VFFKCLGRPANATSCLSSGHYHPFPPHPLHRSLRLRPQQPVCRFGKMGHAQLQGLFKDLKEARQLAVADGRKRRRRRGLIKDLKRPDSRQRVGRASPQRPRHVRAPRSFLSCMHLLTLVLILVCGTSGQYAAWCAPAPRRVRQGLFLGLDASDNEECGRQIRGLNTKFYSTGGFNDRLSRS